MGLKIRLRKQGRTNSACYRLVLAESETKRDGKYLEMLGWYNPIQFANKEENFSIKTDRIDYWLSQGAELTESARALVSRGAPEILRKLALNCEARKTKLAAKRRARRKAAAAQ